MLNTKFPDSITEKPLLKNIIFQTHKCKIGIID